MSNALRTKYLPDDPGRIPSIATRTRKKPSTTTTERIKLHRHTKWEDALSLEYADPSTIEYSYRTGSVKESSNPTAEINGNSVNLTSNLGLPCQPDCSSTTNESIDVPNFVRDKPESYCRFCCSTGNLLSIFPTGEVPNERLLNLLRKLVDIDLTVELDFPSAICKVCVSKLENFDVFRLKCRAYNDEIRKRRVQPSIDVRNRNFSNTEDQIELPVIVKEELMIEDDFYEDSSNNNALLKPTVIEKKATAQLKLNSVEIDMNVYSGENVAPSAAISEELNVDSRVTSKKLAVKEETPNNPISSEQSPWDKSDLTPLLKKPAVAATPSSAFT
ncbi:uncharacterized protein LOC128737118 isoform X2 [Sabethes cyaneus]|uniref:uncharacterized protein LOC128737118 isoform X2 n=1 Tax=Sabethes cyaneus TaxID=53552 RepID=UPI00237DAF86|nr:uncharacterized protein LOC128737118 isoform X2 [Sabethes cyaneus]